jgi:competence protein ComEC
MFSWHQVPFARIILPFITGIITCFYYPAGSFIPITLLCGLLISLLVFRFLFTEQIHFRLKALQGVFLSLCLLTLGYLRTYWHHEMRREIHFSSFEHAKFYDIKIDDAVVEKTKYFRCNATVEQVYDSSGRQYICQGSLLLYFRKSPSVQKPLIGEHYLVRANASALNEPANPGEFSYKRYLAYHNIYHQLFADPAYTIKSPAPEASIYRCAVLFRDACLGIIREYIRSPKEAGVAEALLLGYKDDLDPDITSAFSRTGTLHVLAVSGLHAGIIFLLISFLTRRLERHKRGRWLQLILLLSGIWFYAFMTGLSSSVLRASVMFSIMSLGKILNYKANIYNTLLASAFILLVYQPLYIFDVGFQLSYLAVLGIVWIQPMIDKWYHPRNWLDKYIWGLLSVSLAAQLLTFPISVFYFHQFPNYFLLSNLFMIPLTTIILGGLIILLAVHWIPFVAALCGKLLYALILASNMLVTGIDQLPFSFTNGLYLDFLQLVLVYICVICLVCFLAYRFKWWIFCSTGCCLIYAIYSTYLAFQHNGQRIFIAHQIKGYDVFTCIEGRQAYIISDSGFLSNPSGIKFYIEPFLLERGIKYVKNMSFDQNVVTPNMQVVKNVGLQFFDNIMTIGNTDHKIIQNRHITLMIKTDKNMINFFKTNDNYLIISKKIPKETLRKLRKEYFKLFRKKLELPEKAFIIFN